MADKEIINIELDDGSQKHGNSSKHNNTSHGKKKGKKGQEKLTRSQKRRKNRKKIFIIEAVVLLLLLIFLFLWLKVGLINWDDLKDLKTNKLDEETAEMLEGYTTIALFGVDNRSNGNYDTGNSDSIMICAINNETKEVKIVSVYRDTYLEVDGDGTYRKCNYAYNHGGPQQAIEMLNRNLDLDIQKYISVDFYALAEAVDALGGIELDITEAEAGYMNGSSNGGYGYIDNTAGVIGKSSSHVSVGTQTVDGVQAVAYCRIRYTAGGDFGRAQRQRTVIEKMVEKAKDANLSELNKLVDAVFDDIGTNFTMTQLISLGSAMGDYQLADTAGFPFDKTTGTYGGASLVVPCTLESNVKQLHQYLYGNEDVTLSETVTEISDYVVNYTGCTEENAQDYGY